MKTQSLDITQPRMSYPAYPETQWARDLFDTVLRHLWRVSEVNFTEDVQSWHHKLNHPQRQVIRRILRGFTQTELVIRDYWSTVVAPTFPIPEIAELAIAIAMQECIHAEAYQKLPSTLGIDDYEEFMLDPAANQRLSYIMDSKANRLESLAIFSGAVEGVSLFSAFAILLSYWKELEALKGVSYITTWSAAEEILHSNVAIKLYNMAKTNHTVNDQIVYEGFQAVVDNEMAYIDSVFEGFETESSLPIQKHNLQAFIKQRANRKLFELDLQPIFPCDYLAAQEISDWFDPLMNTSRLADFFAGKDGGTYQAKTSNDYSDLDFSDFSAV